MAFIDFTNGEVLTADQMDTVMRQSVMRFADATARDTALSAVLAEGMMCYLDDTNEVLKYDGSQWIDISGDITGVTAGTALTGGGTSGNVTLDVDTSVVQPNVITTQGDLVIGDASGDPVRLPVGSADQVLTSDGTTVSFQDAGGGAEMYAPGDHIVDLDAGFYDIKFTETPTFNMRANGSITLTEGFNDLPAVTQLEVDASDAFITFQEATLPNEVLNNTSDLNSLAFGNNVFVSVHKLGFITTSTDGENYTLRTSGTNEDLTDVVFANNLFVVVGANGTVLTSSDGITWTTQNANTSEFLRTVFFGDGLFVIAGGAPFLATSPDGVTWTERTTGFGAEAVRGGAFGNGTYLISGSAGLVFTSTDTITWTSRNTGLGAITLIGTTFGGGLFLVGGIGGDAATSQDGISWNQPTTGTSAFIKGAFVYEEGSNFVYALFADSNVFLTSTDATTWTDNGEGGKTVFWNSGAQGQDSGGNNIFLAGGKDSSGGSSSAVPYIAYFSTFFNRNLGTAKLGLINYGSPIQP